uniref:Uncharacterized protein n=1 Tax=Spongospora subterranea TaxID=70186 RepID=A0A0H5QX18_9EUKA|eukprot:CRZ06161.1 hypothetical protein [Spongospora subterranea]
MKEPIRPAGFSNIICPNDHTEWDLPPPDYIAYPEFPSLLQAARSPTFIRGHVVRPSCSTFTLLFRIGCNLGGSPKIPSLTGFRTHVQHSPGHACHQQGQTGTKLIEKFI